MSYASAIGQLNALVAELHTPPGQPRRKFSLDEIRVLLAALGNPHKRFPSVLIAGTNGKGSTAATLAAILVAAGLRAGLYTSPHLERPNERIRVDRAEISDDHFAIHFFRVQDAAQALLREGKLAQSPSFFETLTAIAFLHFAHKGVKLAVLEVGMGGRLDATNVVDPLLSIVTDISLDHTEWLGPTVAAIAREKAGILRPRGTLITLPQHPEANQALDEISAELRVRYVNASAYLPPPGTSPDAPYPVGVERGTVRVDSPLPGAHQRRNVALAIAAAVELGKRGFSIPAAAIAAGIRKTRWPGRLERIEIAGIEWILDVAHNSAGVEALESSLSGFLRGKRPRCLIFSCLRDKPLAEMAETLFPLFDEVVFAPIHAVRAAALEDLLAAARATGVPATAATSVQEAIEVAQAHAAAVVVSGSVYLVGETRSLLRARMEAQP
jgi:dihydrofolate synthase/folylpolyglutamate synthase